MRLKTFHADTLAEAMDLVRETLGPKAIIVATHEDDASRGARVTAAIDPSEPDFDYFSEGASEETLERLTTVLERHGIPNELIDRVIDAATEGEETGPRQVLAGALARVFVFDPLPDAPGGDPLMLIGPPGVGKTVTCAKLAARVAVDHHKANGAPVTLIAADPVRIGAVDQLRAYAERMDASLVEAADATALSAALAKKNAGDMILIDTPGTNPYSLDELAHLVELSEAARPDTVLVLDASRDADEAAALAEAFRPVKPRRLVTTGLDLARRLGAMLSAADAAELSLAEISLTPKIGGGLRVLDADTLAGLLLPDDMAGDARGTGVGAS